MPHSLSQALLTCKCILAVTPEKKRLSKLDSKEKQSVEREKQLKKEIVGNFLCAGEKMLFVDSKVNWSRNQHIKLISVAFEPGKEMLFADSKPPCNGCTQTHLKIILQSSSYNNYHTQKRYVQPWSMGSFLAPFNISLCRRLGRGGSKVSGNPPWRAVQHNGWYTHM